MLIGWYYMKGKFTRLVTIEFAFQRYGERHFTYSLTMENRVEPIHYLYVIFRLCVKIESFIRSISFIISNHVSTRSRNSNIRVSFLNFYSYGRNILPT